MKVLRYGGLALILLGLGFILWKSGGNLFSLSDRVIMLPLGLCFDGLAAFVFTLHDKTKPQPQGEFPFPYLVTMIAGCFGVILTIWGMLALVV